MKVTALAPFHLAHPLQAGSPLEAGSIIQAGGGSEPFVKIEAECFY